MHIKNLHSTVLLTLLEITKMFFHCGENERPNTECKCLLMNNQPPLVLWPVQGQKLFNNKDRTMKELAEMTVSPQSGEEIIPGSVSGGKKNKK